MKLNISDKLKAMKKYVDAAVSFLDDLKNKSEDDLLIFMGQEYFFVDYVEPKDEEIDLRKIYLDKTKKDELLKSIGDYCDAKLKNKNVLIVFGTMGHYQKASELKDDEIKAIVERCEKIKTEGMPKHPKSQRETWADYYTNAKKDGKQWLDKLKDATAREDFYVVRNTAIYYYENQLLEYDKRYEAIDEDAYSIELVGFGNYKDFMYLPGLNAPCYLEVSGRKIGLEICADFEYGNLRFDSDGDGEQDLVFHLVTAQDVYVVGDGASENYACKPSKDGFIFKCDCQDPVYANGEGEVSDNGFKNIERNRLFNVKIST